MNRRRIALGCLFSLIVIALAAGFFLFFGFDYLLNKYIEQQLIIAPGSAIYQSWIDPTVPIYLRIYLFNCTNQHDVVTKMAKPILQQLGPYTFREHRVKVNLQWLPNYTVAFNETRSWYFVPGMSNGLLTDKVTNLNVPIVAAAYLVHDKPAFYSSILSDSMFMFQEGIFTTRSVGEWLFDGFSSSIITLAIRMNLTVPYDKFGWFYKKNNTDDGRYTIFTGSDDISKLAKVDTWMGSRKLPYWRDECKKITGTIGEIWPPHYNKQDQITIFNSDLKRSITLDFKSEEKFRSLEGHRYEVNFKTLANSSVNPSNRCYEAANKSYVSGIFDESGALNAPAYVSFPHFYLADLSLATAVEGLSPNKEEHDTYIIMQPSTGVPMSVAARFQINILLEPLKRIRQFNHVRKVVMPMLWLCETAELDKNTEELLYTLTKQIPRVTFVAAVAALCFGGVLVLIACIILLVGPRKAQPAVRKPDAKFYDTGVNLKCTDYADKKKMKNKF